MIKIKRCGSVNTTIMRIVNSSSTYDYIYIYDENTLVSRKNPDNTTWYYHTDHLGSTTLITDEGGVVIENVSYTPYGEMIDDAGDEKRTYTGKQYDKLTLLYYYGARYYNPDSQKFISKDTIIQNPYNPQSLNGYSYVLNNPYKYIDPTGKAVKGYSKTRVYKQVTERRGNTEVRILKAVGWQVSYTISGKSYSVSLTNTAERALSSQAARQGSTPYSTFSFGRNMQTEYMVSYLEKAQGRSYEPRGPMQRLLQNKGFQIGATVLGGIAGNFFGAGGAAGTFSLADLEEKKTAGTEIDVSDYVEVGADIVVAGAGGKLLKGTASQIAGIEIGNNIIIDVASDVGASVIYETAKSNGGVENE